MRVCVCVYVCVCVRACVKVCTCVCAVRTRMLEFRLQVQFTSNDNTIAFCPRYSLSEFLRPLCACVLLQDCIVILPCLLAVLRPLFIKCHAPCLSAESMALWTVVGAALLCLVMLPSVAMAATCPCEDESLCKIISTPPRKVGDEREGGREGQIA